MKKVSFIFGVWLMLVGTAWAAAPTITGVIKLNNNFADGSQLEITTTGLSGGKPVYFLQDHDFGAASAGDDLAETLTATNGVSPTVTNTTSRDPTYRTSTVRGDVGEYYKSDSWKQQTIVWDTPHYTELYIYFWWALPDDMVPGETTTKDFSGSGNMKQMWFLGPNSTTNDMVPNSHPQLTGNNADPGDPGRFQMGTNDLTSAWNISGGSYSIGVNDSGNASGGEYWDWTNITENWHFVEFWMQAGSDPCDTSPAEGTGPGYYSAGNGDGTNATEERWATTSKVWFGGSASGPGAGCGVDRLHTLGFYTCNGCDSDTETTSVSWFDKIYVALGTNAASRVMIGDDYSTTIHDAAHRELQLTDSWTNGTGKIIVTINSGSLTLGSGKYLFVCNEANECSAGFDLSGATNQNAGAVFLGAQ